MAGAGTIPAVHTGGGTSGDRPDAPDPRPFRLARPPGRWRRRLWCTSAVASGAGGRTGAPRGGSRLREPCYPGERGIRFRPSGPDRAVAVSLATRSAGRIAANRAHGAPKIAVITLVWIW